MSTVAIIPARGGSKGIRKKNLRPVCGKPLVVWSIEQALAAESVDHVYVTTDDDEISAVAARAGARVLPRAPAAATDEATSEAALLDALARIDEPELVVFLQPTSPCRQPHDIDGAVATLRTHGDDSLFSARTVEGFIWISGAQGSCIPTRRHRVRRQELTETWYEENGSLYVFYPRVLRETGNRLGGRIGVHLMHPLDSFQIDNESDIDLVQSMMVLRCVAKWPWDGVDTTCP